MCTRQLLRQPTHREEKKRRRGEEEREGKGEGKEEEKKEKKGDFQEVKLFRGTMGLIHDVRRNGLNLSFRSPFSDVQ